jgi:hypothetical protein
MDATAFVTKQLALLDLERNAEAAQVGRLPPSRRPGLMLFTQRNHCRNQRNHCRVQRYSSSHVGRLRHVHRVGRVSPRRLTRRVAGVVARRRWYRKAIQMSCNSLSNSG